MRKELDERLCKEFPVLYRDRNGPMTQTCMCWGFEVGDGWFNLIYNLSKVIDNEIYNAKNEVIYQYKRDNDLDFHTDLPEDVLIQLGIKGPDEMKIVVTQVKEKYGGLSFYIGGQGHIPLEYYGRIEGAISMAECLSFDICEECGNHGTTRGRGWLRTLCEKHAIEQGYDVEEKEDTSDVGGEA